MNQYLVLSRIKVQNANCIAGFTWGFPAVTHFLGFTHAIQRKLSKDYDLSFNGCAIVTHDYQLRVYKPNPRANFEFIQSKNPPVLTKHKTSSPPIIEEGKMNLTTSIIIEVSKELIATDEKLKAFKQSVLDLCLKSRLAGGSILSIGRVDLLSSSTDEQQKKLNKKIPNLNLIKKIDIYTSHHTHYVIGTGANDPQKMDPNASRETLDHSIMYIFAVALEDADWHHIKSYTKQRANQKRTIKIWKSIKTHEDKKWTKKYHDPNPKNKSFGAKVVVTLTNGKKIMDQLDKANAHPYGSRPFKRQNYVEKFLTLTDGILDKKESSRFLKTVQNLKNLKSGQLYKLNIKVKKNQIKKNFKKGIF